ncbi:hypothetical protein TrST_g12562 [Triparma strigata]|uniref:Uncharacterized protein n=1 Tax=Triparma strigata TaxID=1606541 RepID=A0A9W7B1V0_9STRA|nr:hypothetical protein TrST_g12562 [Triparma strigata]
MRAECLFEDDGDYYAGKIGPVQENGESFSFLFDDGDVREMADVSMLKKLPLPEILRELQPQVAVGASGECLYRDDGEYYAGTVATDNGNGTYTFSFVDGDVCEDARPEELRNLVAPPHVMEKILDDTADLYDQEQQQQSQDNDDLQFAGYEEDFADDFDEEEEKPETEEAAQILTKSNSDLNVILSSTGVLPGSEGGGDAASKSVRINLEESSKINLDASQEPAVLNSSLLGAHEELPERKTQTPAEIISQDLAFAKMFHQDTHSLLIPSNPNSTNTGPLERFHSLSLEYVDLLYQYEAAKNVMGSRVFSEEEEKEQEEKAQDEANKGEPETLDQAPFKVKVAQHGHPPQTQQTLINSMTALKMRSKALVNLTYGEDCLEHVAEVVDLATNYGLNGMHVQAEAHSRKALETLDQELLKAPQPPNVFAKHSATALIFLFDSIRTILNRVKGGGNVPLKDLRELLQDQAFAAGITISVKELEDDAEGPNFHGVDSIELLNMLRGTDGFKSALTAVEESLRPIQVATIKSVVARCERNGGGGEKEEEGAKDIGECSAPLASDLIKAFKETPSTYCLIESTGIIQGLRRRVEESEEDKASYQGRVSYEELLSMLSVDSAVSSRKDWASKMRVDALTLIGSALSSQGKWGRALEKFGEARQIVINAEREDMLSSCRLFSAYSDCLLKKHMEGGGEGSTKKKKKKKKNRIRENISKSSEGGPGVVFPSAGVDDLKLADEIMTHCLDIIESCFGVNHVCVAKASCDVAFLAVVRQEDQESLDMLKKAFEIYRTVEGGGGGKGIGVGTASTSVSMGRLRLKNKEDIEGGLSDIKYGAEYYKSVGDAKALQLYNYVASVYEEQAGCIDYDVVENLKEAAASAALSHGKNSTACFEALRKLGDKCEEGGEFDGSIAAYKKAIGVGQVVFSANDIRLKKCKKKLAFVVAELKGENLDEGEEVEGSKFFHAEKLATQEILAAEEERIKKLKEAKAKEEQKTRKKLKKKKKKKKKAAADEEEKKEGEKKVEKVIEMKRQKKKKLKKKVKIQKKADEEASLGAAEDILGSPRAEEKDGEVGGGMSLASGSVVLEEKPLIDKLREDDKTEGGSPWEDERKEEHTGLDIGLVGATEGKGDDELVDFLLTTKKINEEI